MSENKEKQQVEEKEDDFFLLKILLIMGAPLLIIGLILQQLPNKETFGDLPNIFLIISYVLFGLAGLCIIELLYVRFFPKMKQIKLNKNKIIWGGLGFLFIGCFVVSAIITPNYKNMTIDEIYQVIQDIDVYEIRKITSKMENEQIDELVNKISEKRFYQLIEGLHSVCGIYGRGSGSTATISVPAYSVISDLCPKNPFSYGKAILIDIEWGNPIRREENDRYHNSSVRLEGTVTLLKNYWPGQEIADRPIIRTPYIDDLW